MTRRRPLTTAQALALTGMQRNDFHSAMHKLRARGQDFRTPRETWPDGRSPLWDAARLATWVASRTGD